MTDPIDGSDASQDGRSGWGQPLSPGRRPALILIDMVAAYFAPGGVFELPDKTCLDVASELLAFARDRRWLVVHTRVEYGPGCVDGGVFVKKVAGLAVFARGADERAGRHMEAVAPERDEVVIVKQMPSAFFGTSLASTLTAAGVDTVVIGGVSTSGCVRATATDAMSHGFVPFVVADACGDRREAIHQANLSDLATKYAEVLELSHTMRLFAGQR